jgi:four helix bundle protein
MADSADQMRRASRSVCANLAEGWGKLTSENERRQFIRTAHGSAVEMQVWLDYCRDVDYMNEVDVAAFQKEYSEIGAMLRGLMAK